MKKIKCAIVDDEPIALEGLRGYVEKIPYLECVGEFSSALDLLEKIDQINPELLFLDIQMPYLTGIDFLKSLKKPPKVVFTTAYDNYALEGYELDIVDYLMKPISFNRFLKACEKVKKDLKEDPPDSFFIKTDKRTEKIFYEDIQYIEGFQNYLKLNCLQEKHIVHITLKSFLEQLPETQFIQVHKSFIINLKAIKALEGNQLVIGKDKIPISRSYKDEVVEKIINSKLIRR
ncbi:LytR/AlgR family response regulator transcription factor [Flexithrix dorotheae]|uniref:LytR/AlgR family response regulator transcription factor n=1 Tax=Flexithrix dorotheae TaxID=70993 RepID=UPI00036968CF|nr:LytTR family DNA-binding domain-containing protein [Flexithrix dorotheae]